MDNAEKLMKEMGEAIEQMKSIPDYKTRMNEEVNRLHEQRAANPFYTCVLQHFSFSLHAT